MVIINKKIIYCLVFISFLLLFSFSAYCKRQEQAVPNKQKITNELFEAAGKGDFETVKNLLTKYPEMKNVRRNDGRTLLHVSSGSRELIKYLIENGADIEAKSDGGSRTWSKPRGKTCL
jgi:ankyrin repeat protein